MPALIGIGGVVTHAPRRVGLGNCTPSLSLNRTLTFELIRLVPPTEDGRLPPTSSSSGCPLTRIRTGDVLPLLLGNYPGSTLLWSSPPLACASLHPHQVVNRTLTSKLSIMLGVPKKGGALNAAFRNSLDCRLLLSIHSQHHLGATVEVNILALRSDYRPLRRRGSLAAQRHSGYADDSMG